MCAQAFAPRYLNFGATSAAAMSVRSSLSGRLNAGNKKPGICRVCIRMVRVKGLEPSRGCPHTDLNRTRLPIPPHPRGLTACFRLLRKREEILHDSLYMSKTFFRKNEYRASFALLFVSLWFTNCVGLARGLLGAVWRFAASLECSWIRYTTSTRR